MTEKNKPTPDVATPEDFDEGHTQIVDMNEAEGGIFMDYVKKLSEKMEADKFATEEDIDEMLDKVGDSPVTNEDINDKIEKALSGDDLTMWKQYRKGRANIAEHKYHFAEIIKKATETDPDIATLLRSKMK